jgi:hypothetical protein
VDFICFHSDVIVGASHHYRHCLAISNQPIRECFSATRELLWDLVSLSGLVLRDGRTFLHMCFHGAKGVRIASRG